MMAIVDGAACESVSRRDRHIPRMVAKSGIPGGAGVRLPPVTLGAALADLARRPVHWLVRQWNWKAALLSTLARGSIFFSVNLTASWDSAVNAVVTELLYRALMAGTLASVSQTFRHVQPAWQGSLLVLVALPALSHGIEFTVHSLRGTERLHASIAVSILFTICSCVLSYWLHRRSTLIVGEGARPFREDLLHLPLTVFDLLVRQPFRPLLERAACRAGRRNQV